MNYGVCLVKKVTMIDQQMEQFQSRHRGSDERCVFDLKLKNGQHIQRYPSQAT